MRSRTRPATRLVLSLLAAALVPATVAHAQTAGTGGTGGTGGAAGQGGQKQGQAGQKQGQGGAPAPLPAPSVPVVPPLTQILGRATDRSVALNVLSPTAIDAYVEYGTAANRLTSKTPVARLAAKTPAVLTITGLSPNRRYSYRLRTRAPGKTAYATGATHVLTTQRAAGTPFTFAIEADPHNRDPRFSGPIYTATLQNARLASPDFLVDLGDTFMTEKSKPGSPAEAEATFVEMRPYLGVIGADAGLYLVNGNHEAELGWLTQGPQRSDLPLWATQLREQYYPNPAPDRFYSGASAADALLGAPRDAYYSWTWGDARFVVLDPFWYTREKPKAEIDGNWAWTLGQDQYQWLKATLEQNTSRYTFVFLHHLVGGSSEGRGGVEVADKYEWGGKNADGSDGFAAHRPGWAAPVHTLLVQHHVSAVFHGHDHVFVKQDLDGVVYQEVPQPSNAGYGNAGLASEYGYTHGDALGGTGHLRVTVGPDAARVEYVVTYLPQDERADRKNGTVAYSYAIPPSTPTRS